MGGGSTSSSSSSSSSGSKQKRKQRDDDINVPWMMEDVFFFVDSFCLDWWKFGGQFFWGGRWMEYGGIKMNSEI